MNISPYVQAILFEKSKWSLIAARKWLLEHNIHPIKPVHSTNSLYRFRLITPQINAKYHTRKIGSGIMLILMHF